jgi:parvulin-like peptidyl-prolyl isomerase
MAFIINGEQVDDSVLEEEFESIKEHYQNLGEVVCCDRDDEFWQYAKDNVVNRFLLEQESNAKFGEVSDEEAEARFEALKAEHGGEQEFYDNTGFNPGDRDMIKAKLKSSITVDRLLEAEIEEIEHPSDEDLEAYYQANIDRYLSQEEVRLSQIFIEPSSQDAAREAYIALRKLREEILDGKDFDEAAREHGSDEDRDIDLGFMKQGETLPEVEAITFSMRIGEVSPVIATHYGFHVFKVTERKEPAPIPRDQIENLAEQYASDKRNDAVEAVIEKLKEKSTIEEVSSEAE